MSTISSFNTPKNEKIVSLIFSHNSRMQCFMERFKKDDKKGEKIRFKNGAIIKLVVENETIKPSLVYEGELDEKETKKIIEKGAYYTKNSNTKNKNIRNLKDKVGNSEKNLSDSFKIFSDYFVLSPIKTVFHKNVDFDDNKIYEFYIIRHGQGIHNGVNPGIKILSGLYYKDATLTDTGKEQAKRSGIALNKILGNDKVNYLFASDLRRTRETLVNVLDGIVKNSKLNLKNPKIIILPCSHEISVEKNKGDKSCDELEASSSKKMAVENFPSCVMGRGILKGTFGFDKDKDCKYQNQYYIDWSYYLAFYNNTMRGISSRSWTRLRCSDTNMVVEALNIIKNGPGVIKQYQNKIKKSGNSQVNENNNLTNTETVSNNSNIIITQQYLNEISAISKILKNSIGKYRWANPPKNLSIANKRMNIIVRNLKDKRTHGDFMKISGENDDIISSIKKIIPEELLNKEVQKIKNIQKKISKINLTNN